MVDMQGCNGMFLNDHGIKQYFIGDLPLERSIFKRSGAATETSSI